MLYLLHGQDSYRKHAFLNALRDAVGPPDVRDANVSWLTAAEAEPDVVTGMTHAMPFMAERRLVVIEGLLTALSGEGRTGRGRGRSQRQTDWEAKLAAMGETLPPTSDVALVEGQLRANNPLLRALSGVAEVKEFAPLPPNELREWVQRRVAAVGGSMAPQAVQTLVDLVGSDLWALSGDVEKLTLYAAGRTVTGRDVEELVVSAREVSVFAMVDAVLEGNRGVAMRSLARLLEGEATVSYLLAMLSRQVRLMLLAKALVADAVPQGELGARLAITSAFALRKTLELARRFPQPSLHRLHRGLLDTDLAIKTGAMPERLALEYLVAEVCQSLARPAARAYG